MHKKLTRLFSKGPKRPSFLYDKITNFNFEEHRDHIKQFASALKQKTNLTQKVDEPVSKKKVSRIKKDVDADTTNYHIWRELEYNKNFSYPVDITFTVNGKIRLRPIDLSTAFGLPHLAGIEMPKSNAVFVFQDNYLDTFFLYDHQKEGKPEREFEFFWEFWKSEEEHEFRISHTDYAHRYKFKRMLYETVEKVNSGELLGFEAMVEKERGSSQVELFDDFEKEYNMIGGELPAVFKHKRKDFEKFGKSQMGYIEDKEFDKEVERAVDLRKDADAYVVE